MVLSNYIKNIGIVLSILFFIFLLNPYDLTVKSGYGLIAILVLLKGRTITHAIDKDFLVLLAFGFTYSMFNYFGDNKGVQYLIIQAFFPIFFYSLGKLIIHNNLSAKQIIYLLLGIGFVYSITILLSTIFNLVDGGFEQSDRFVPSYWNGNPIKATTAASYLIYNSIIPAVIVANKKRFGIVPIAILLLIYIVTLICSFRLGSRTLIAISLVSCLVTILYIIYKQNLRSNLKFIATLVAIAIIVYLYVPINWNSPIFSTLGQRFKTGGAVESTATAGNRTGLWMDGLVNLFENPLGWKSRHFHHNMWLDTAKNGGIIPLLFFIINNIFCYKYIKKSLALPNKDFGLNITFILFFLSTFLLFFTEPVIDGNFFSIVLYCFFFGVLKKYLQIQNQRLTNI